MEPEVLRDYVVANGGKAVACDDVSTALKQAKGDSPLCVCGSLYLVGAVKRILHF